jgi:soluble lytic murein transglycosylase-like protein
MPHKKTTMTEALEIFLKYLRILILLLSVGLVILLYGHCAQAAEKTTTQKALSIVCPGSEYLAEYVDSASRRYMVNRLTLVAQIWSESRCNPKAIGAMGEVGLMQLHGVAKNGLKRHQLLVPRTNIFTGARWLSLRERDCGSAFWGLSGYNAKTCKGGRRYARRVLKVVRRIRKAMERYN